MGATLAWWSSHIQYGRYRPTQNNKNENDEGNNDDDYDTNNIVIIVVVMASEIMLSYLFFLYQSTF